MESSAAGMSSTNAHAVQRHDAWHHQSECGDEDTQRGAKWKMRRVPTKLHTSAKAERRIGGMGFVAPPHATTQAVAKGHAGWRGEGRPLRTQLGVVRVLVIGEGDGLAMLVSGA
ncbi:hypothetical protein CYMTET_45598 [Cymbomonas tetramitiformis]|uniref:Uncharacterized protein n=1 Tax=Cymbomonas tetramitiformis TaxID=36881 RepID=A0AAE0BXX0_9CHLO|nr:hypothetical protein CYMTET_45598 [Cymbomonas tetramitiformis]